MAKSKTLDLKKLQEGERFNAPVGLIDPSPYQPRDFNLVEQSKLVELGQSIKEHGQLSDCTVRVVGDRLELIGGERRFRAIKAAKLRQVACKLVTADDTKAAELAFFDNENREDLSPLERVRGFKRLLDMKVYPTQAKLAKAVGLTGPALSNQLRVLELPQKWLDFISQEKYGLTVTHGRYIHAWKDRQVVLDQLESDLKHRVNAGPANDFSRYVIGRSVMKVSRPLSKPEFIGNDFVTPRLTQAQKKDAELDIVECDVDSQKEKRAFNVDLWNRYQQEGERRAKKSSHGKDVKATQKDLLSGKGKPAAEDPAVMAKKLYRWKLTQTQLAISEKLAATTDVNVLIRHLLWFATANCSYSFTDQRSRELVAAIANAGGKTVRNGKDSDRFGSVDVWGTVSTVNDKGLVETLATSLAAWYLHDLASQYSDLDPWAIEAAAQDLDVDIVRDWKLQQSFLELFTKFQLVGLADEWNVDAGDDVDLSTMGKELLIATLLEYAPEDQPPSRIRKLKPVP